MELISHTETEESLSGLQQPLNTSQANSGSIVQKMNHNNKKLEMLTLTVGLQAEA